MSARNWVRFTAWVGMGVLGACGSSKPSSKNAASAEPSSRGMTQIPVPDCDGGNPEPPPGTAVDPMPANASLASAPPPSPTAEGATAAAPPSAPNDVQVQNIGLHIGGGPNDAQTKAPFIEAIRPHFDGFARCYDAVSPEGPAIVSVDLLVPASGGAAEVAEVRTGFKKGNFPDCIRSEFASVTFSAPKLGATKFSYSLRLSRK